ncbi:hypothetical protein BKI52_38800 [marine bacterium AO1-C]|nr:hypothetical protein BKI52_38800 [marine bacterium AO1-C]
MKQLFMILLSFLLACSSGEQNRQKPDATGVSIADSALNITEEKPRDTLKIARKSVLSGHALIDKVSEIKSVPYRKSSLQNGKLVIENQYCGDTLFWQIVQLGQEAIPYLITKILDNTQTRIKIPCRDVYLNVGAVAYIILTHMVSIPKMLVFDIQFDYFEINCDFGYFSYELEYINDRPKDAHRKLTKWYHKYKSKITKEKIKFDNEPDCRKQYNIDYELEIEYD